MGRVLRRAAEPEIVVAEEQGVRYLHFGSEWVQGAMNIERPDRLVLDYVRDMMVWLLVLSPPPRLLQLGLGAAALTRFCRRHLPGCELTVVERSRLVIETARALFALPRDDHRLRVVRADAGAFVAAASARHRYGVLQVDLYDAQARGPVLDSLAFYRGCRSALSEPGVLVVNLFGHPRILEPNLDRLRRVFGPQVFALPPTSAGNVVVMALAGPPLDVSSGALLARARTVARRYGLPATPWAEALARQIGAGARAALPTARGD